MFRKTTQLQLSESSVAASTTKSSRVTLTKLSDFKYTPEPGMLYTVARAISNRVNANYDGWPADELRKAYRTFVGRGVYVDHHNHDYRRARGVVLDSILRESKVGRYEDVSVHLLKEIDPLAYPKLSKALLSGDLATVSMGADVEYTICSICQNKAHDESEFCDHVRSQKGLYVPVDINGQIVKKLVWEDCYEINFFEISYVFDPADESAYVSDVMLAEGERTNIVPLASKVKQRGTSVTNLDRVAKTSAEYVLPEVVDTLRTEQECPAGLTFTTCEFNGLVCDKCGYEEPPEGLDDPDFSKAMPVEERQEDQEDAQREWVEDKEDATRRRDEDLNNQLAPRGGSMSRLDELARPVSGTSIRTRLRSAGDLDVEYDQETTIDDFDVPPAEPASETTDELINEETDADIQNLNEKIVQARRATRLARANFTREALRRQRVKLTRRKQGAWEEDGLFDDQCEPFLKEDVRAGDTTPEQILENNEDSGLEYAWEVAQEEGASREEFEAAFKAWVMSSKSRKRANDAVETDVEDLDNNPVSEDEATTPDATANVEAPTKSQEDQLQEADRSNEVNDRTDTGFDGQNDDSQAFNDYEYKEAQKRSRTFKALQLQEEREELGLSKKAERFKEVARLERMSDEEFLGYSKALREVKSARMRVASKRTEMNTSSPSRLPAMGRRSSVGRTSIRTEDRLADDAVAFL